MNEVLKETENSVVKLERQLKAVKLELGEVSLQKNKSDMQSQSLTDYITQHNNTEANKENSKE